MMGEQFGKCDRCQQVMYAGHECRAMTTETLESLQEIERLVNQCGAAIDSYIGEGSECDILMAAITRVVQESEKQVEIVKSLHRETREELYAKELLVAERDARIAVLEKALREYGKHKSGCYDKRQVVPRCVCGLNTALASRDAP